MFVKFTLEELCLKYITPTYKKERNKEKHQKNTRKEFCILCIGGKKRGVQ